jgi:hypothetical protein
LPACLCLPACQRLGQAMTCRGGDCPQASGWGGQWRSRYSRRRATATAGSSTASGACAAAGWTLTPPRHRPHRHARAARLYPCLSSGRHARTAPRRSVLSRQEVSVLSQLKHENIICFYAACTVPPNICIIEELAEGGSLHTRLHGRPGKRKTRPLQYPQASAGAEWSAALPSAGCCTAASAAIGHTCYPCPWRVRLKSLTWRAGATAGLPACQLRDSLKP